MTLTRFPFFMAASMLAMTSSALVNTNAEDCFKRLGQEVAAAWSVEIAELQLAAVHAGETSTICEMSTTAEVVRVEPAYPSRYLTAWVRRGENQLEPIRVVAHGFVRRWTPSRDIRPGEPLLQKDFHEGLFELGSVRGISDLVLDGGLYAAHSLYRDQLVSAASTRRFTPVQVGDVLKVSATQGRATIATTALAQAGAEIGGYVMALTLAGEPIPVRITGKGQGRVVP